MTDGHEPAQSGSQDQGQGRGLTRREFVPRAAGAVATLALGGALGYELHPSGAKIITRLQTDSIAQATSVTVPSTGVKSFASRPDLSPPAVTITHLHGASAAAGPRFILAAPLVADRQGLGQGLMIVDRHGRLVYFRPVTTESYFNFSVQAYHDESVLAWWQGSVESGHGEGTSAIADDSYRQLATIRAGNHLQADLHELYLTSRGTAYISAYQTRNMDLRSVGGSKSHPTFVGHVQEVDLETGKLLWDWDPSKHVAVKESYQPYSPRSAFDYLHLNSISETPDGNLLVSGRNTWALYKVDRRTGKIIWRLGGKRSDFTIERAARFYWQHHSRLHGARTLTVFDNALKREKQSRGLLLSVDERTMRVKLAQQYVHPAAIDSTALGSVQLLPDGRVFVGWGDLPYFSEFAPDGTMLLDGQMPVGTRSYRAFTQDWVGRPRTAPAVAAHPDPAGGFAVHASWNGATEIARWRVLAGAHRDALEPVGAQEWTGFETSISVNSAGPHFVAVAEDASGRELGRSAAA